MSIPIAVLASGRGSGFEAISSAVRRGVLDAEIVALVSDQKNAPALAKAKDLGYVAHVVSTEGYRKDHEAKILDFFSQLPTPPRFLVLAGYMRVFSPHLIEAFRSGRGYSRMVNVHPSLLPAFSGVKGYEQAFSHGCKVAGVSIHLVEPEVDDGPICAQEAFSIADCRSVEEVESRGLAVEHRLFPETLKWVLPEKFALEERDSVAGRKRRLCVRSN